MFQGGSAFVEPLRLPQRQTLNSEERKVERPNTPLLDAVMHLAKLPNAGTLDAEWNRLMTSEEQEQQRRACESQRATAAALKASELAATTNLIQRTSQSPEITSQSSTVPSTGNSELQAVSVADQVIVAIRKEFLQPQADQLAKVAELERAHAAELEQLKQHQIAVDRKLQQTVEERFVFISAQLDFCFIFII